MTSRNLLAVAVLSLLAAPVGAAGGDPIVRVQFDKGSSSKTIKGSIKGYSGLNYLVGARTGQTMTVDLKTGSASNYFNVWAPRAGDALYNSSTGQNRYSFKVPANGDYRVQVYLMRDAARRNETASYTVTIGLR